MERKDIPLQFDQINTQTIDVQWLSENEVHLDVLRLDKLHPVVSGNKWFKLKHYLNEAGRLNKTTIATFGGAFSNHIIATAYTCRALGFESVGFIRGEISKDYSPTLQQAEQYGMKLIFLNRLQYKQRKQVAAEFATCNWYWIEEGGYGLAGASGAQDILSYATGKHYSHIVASVGTGTMLAGLINGCLPGQHVTGLSSMKGNYSLDTQIRALLKPTENTSFTLVHDYHFGGYARYTDELIAFIKQAYVQFNLPLDFVYTGKLFFAIEDLVKKGLFPRGSSLLMIHSGGLQGNAFLHKNALSFL